MLEGVSQRPPTVVHIDVPLFDDVAQNSHHALCLLICKAFFFQALNELECIEVVIFGLWCCGAEAYPAANLAALFSGRAIRCLFRAEVIGFVAHRSGAVEERCRLASTRHCAAGLKLLVGVHDVCGSRNRGTAVLEITGAAIVVLRP